MNAKFEVRTTMSDKLVLQASKLYTAMTQRVQKLLRLCVGAVLLVEGFAMLWLGQGIGWVLIAGSIYLFAAAMLLAKVVYKRTVKANEEHMGIITTIRFDKDRFLVSNRLEAESIPYADVRKVGENKDSFCIVSGKANGTHLPKDCFTIGSAEEFRAFIEEKAGKKIKFIR